MSRPVSIALYASGSGTNAENLIRVVPPEVATFSVVFTDRVGAGVRARAASLGVRDIWLAPEQVSGGAAGAEQLAMLSALGVEMICLAGYLRQIPAEVTQAYPGRILNIHPSLLPAFGGKGMYGLNVHRAVLERGCLWTGATVHVVTEAYDEGPILAQRPVPVLPGDTPESLQGRVLQTEYTLYPQAVVDVAQAIARK